MLIYEKKLEKGWAFLLILETKPQSKTIQIHKETKNFGKKKKKENTNFNFGTINEKENITIIS